MPTTFLPDQESADRRDVALSAGYAFQSQRRNTEPYLIVSLVFFSILIAFVVMLMIIILVFLKQGFSGVQLILQ